MTEPARGDSDAGAVVASTGTPSVARDVLEEGAVWRVRLVTPRANIIDMDKIARLASVFEQAKADPGLKAIILEGDGPHFSFGAGVEDHLPGRCREMIPAFHRLFGVMLESSVICLAAVRGQCLGGGLEIAAFCHRVFAAHDAHLGQPEIRLGVFAPVASVILPERVGRSRAEDLCLSGRPLAAEEAFRIGLVDELCQDPFHAALAYAREHLLPRSASSLRIAARAIRTGMARRLASELAEVERLYLEDLMSTRDAEEGLRAFLEKRPARWVNG